MDTGICGHRLELPMTAQQASNGCVEIHEPRRKSGHLPNGSRLSCGASAGGRKHPALLYQLVGAQTNASSEAGPVSFKRLLGSIARMCKHANRIRTVDRRKIGGNVNGGAPVGVHFHSHYDQITHSDLSACLTGNDELNAVRKRQSFPRAYRPNEAKVTAA